VRRVRSSAWRLVWDGMVRERVVMRAPRCGRRVREVHHELRARREGVGMLIEVYRMRSASARKDRETWQRVRRSE